MNTHSSNAKAAAGFVFILAGALLLADNFGLHLPSWLLSWPMLLIAIGLVNGLKHNFKKPAAFILLFIGSVFLADRLLPGKDLDNLIVPGIIVLIGVHLLSGKNGKYFSRRDSAANG
jgi:hypothetical protein